MSDSNLSERPSAKVTWVDVLPDQSGQRIDNFLRTKLKGVPKSLIYRLLRKGEIRVNKKRIKPEYKIQSGDLIRIAPIRVPEKGESAPASESLLELLDRSVLFEDDRLLVINKPSGLAVHGGSGVALGLIEAIRQLRPSAHFLELVHRLDRDTSGCIMIAKKRSTLRLLHEALRQRQVEKIYQALVVGRWDSRQKFVDAPLLRDELRSGERLVRVDQQGKPSYTGFTVLRRFGDVATLVEARPRTGRTHQIRVHAQFVGHPIVGDIKYTPDNQNLWFKERGLKRLMLHAAGLVVELTEGVKIEVSAPLDANLSAIIDKL